MRLKKTFTEVFKFQQMFSFSLAKKNGSKWTSLVQKYIVTLTTRPMLATHLIHQKLNILIKGHFWNWGWRDRRGVRIYLSKQKPKKFFECIFLFLNFASRKRPYFKFFVIMNVCMNISSGFFFLQLTICAICVYNLKYVCLKVYFKLFCNT